MPATRQPALTLYQVCHDPQGKDPCEPLSPMQYGCKRKALTDLRDYRQHHPNSYLAQITYTRLPDAQKGR
ncbi:MAG: hypothetical protein Q8L77_14550 [Nitrospirota bacterium]|nr:hypothetical protein [Nitrospirota bacterium]